MSGSQGQDEGQRVARLRALLALEADRIVHDLEARKGFMMGVWARLRSREPFLETLFTRWRTVAVADLALLTEEQLVAMDAFHAALDDLRLYLRFTEDMPITLSERYDTRIVAIRRRGQAAIAAMGGVPAHPERPPALTLDDVPDPPPPPDLPPMG